MTDTTPEAVAALIRRLDAIIQYHPHPADPDVDDIKAARDALSRLTAGAGEAFKAGWSAALDAQLEHENGGTWKVWDEPRLLADAWAAFALASPAPQAPAVDVAARLEQQVPATRHYLVQNGIDAHFADVLLSHYLDIARDVRDAALHPAEPLTAEALCEDCPPVGYPTDETRCSPCPRRPTAEAGTGEDAFVRKVALMRHRQDEDCSRYDTPEADADALDMLIAEARQIKFPLSTPEAEQP